MLDIALLQKAKDAGIHTIFYGVESGNQNVLNTIKKGTTVGEIKRAFALTHKVGIKTIAAFMVGNVGDTVETINDSIKLAQHIKPSAFGFSIATPLPGTEFYGIAKERGWICSDDFSQWSQFTAVSRNADLTREEITKLRDFADKQVRGYPKKKGRFRLNSIAEKLKVKIKSIPIVGPLLVLTWRSIGEWRRRYRQICAELAGQREKELASQREKELLVDTIEQQLKVIEKDYNEPKMTELVWQLVTQSQMESETFKRWCHEIKERPRYHRKQWEYAYVLQGLYENDLLRPGRLGLGFGVGTEPLPALMAKYGCKVVATDMDVESAKKIGWVDTKQHSVSTNDLNNRGICERDKFNSLVSFLTTDMNNIDARLESMRFDFIWSCCAIDHLGAIELGKRFINETIKLLKPGGISIHTTEYNVSSDGDTLDHQELVLFRRKDIESLVKDLNSDGHDISFNPHTGNGYVDKFFDTLPYEYNNHLKLVIGPYVSTSIGLLIKKPKLQQS